MSVLPFGRFASSLSAGAKAEASGHPNLPRSLPPHSLLWQWLTLFLESLYTASCASTAALPSVAVAFGRAPCMHSLGLSPPCRTCHCSICGHLPPLALLLILASPPSDQDLVWWRSLPCHQPPLGARVAQLPQPHPGPACLGELCRLGPVQGMAPASAPLGHLAGAQYLCGLWPSEGQFGKRQGGGSKQGLSSFPGTCRGLQAFCGPCGLVQAL